MDEALNIFHSVFLFIALAIPFSIVFLCNQLVMDEAKKELYAVIILLIVHFCGTLAVLILVRIRFSKRDIRLECVYRKEDSFFKIKLISVYIFGTCYSLFCGLCFWKQIDKKDELADLIQTDIKGVGIASYITTFIHISILSIYLAVFDKELYLYTPRVKLISGFAIFFTCIGTSIDALSSEFLYNTHTNSTLPPQDVPRAVEVMKKLEPLISSTIIGFFLMTIDLLFSKGNNTLSCFDLQNKNSCSQRPDDLKIKLRKTFIHHIFILTSFGMFAFSATEILTSDPSADLKAYVITQIVIKCINLVLVLIILSILIGFLCKKCENTKTNCKCSCTIFPLNISFLIIIVTCIFHTFYHLVCSFRNEYIANASIKIYVLVENIITIIIAVLQTLFVLGSYSCRKCENCVSKLCKEFVHFVCSLIGIMNLGIWVSDIIGKERLIYKPENNIWEICKTFSLLFSNFFLLQIGLEFLKLYWRNEKKKTKENSVEEPIEELQDN